MIKFPKLLQLQARERLLVAGSGFVLLVVVLDRLVLAPWLSHAQTVRAGIDRMEHALQTGARLLERKDQVLAERERYGRYVRPVVADDLQVAALIKEIEELARQSHVHVGEINPSAVETTGVGKHYVLDVQLECTLEQWVEFVYQIESSTSLYEVARASLERKEGAPTQLQGTLRLVSAMPPTGDSERLMAAGASHATTTP